MNVDMVVANNMHHVLHELQLWCFGGQGTHDQLQLHTMYQTGAHRTDPTRINEGRMFRLSGGYCKWSSSGAR